MPIRHGMTLGELAKLFNAENKIGADLTVVPMKNWRRDDWFDETALPWISPSPNMRNMNEAALYTGHRRDRGDEPVGRPRHRHAVRARRRAVDRRRAARRRAERARDPRRPLLSGALHAGVEQVRERGVPGRLHHRDRPRGAPSRARRPRDRVGAHAPVSGAVPARRSPRACSARATRSPGSRPATTPPRSPRPGRPAEARWRLLRAKYLLYP